jgi:hypothetical protein
VELALIMAGGAAGHTTPLDDGHLKPSKG